MSWRARLRRFALVLALALVHALVLAWSAAAMGLGEALAALPPLPHPWLQASPLGPYPTVLAVSLVLPLMIATRKPGREVAGLALVTSFVQVPAAYPWANLDWSTLVRDVGLTHGGVPGPGVVGAAALPWVLILAYHALTLSRATRRHYADKGTPDGQARAAGRAVPRWAGAAGLGGVGAGVLLAVGLRAVEGLPKTLPGLGPLGTPVAFGVVVVAAVVLLLRDVQARHEPDA